MVTSYLFMHLPRLWVNPCICPQVSSIARAWSRAGAQQRSTEWWSKWIHQGLLNSRQYYFPVQFFHWANQSFLGWTYYGSEGHHSFPYHFWHSSVVWIYLFRKEVPKTDCVFCITILLAQYTWHNYCSSQGHQDNLYMDRNDTSCLCCHITLQMHI